MLYFERYAPAVGRLLLIVLFFVSGVGKVAAPAATKAYIAFQGLPFPDLAYWLAVIVELIVGALFLVGFQTRLAAAALAIYSLSTAVLFHHNLGDQGQMLNFLKDVAIAGGFLQVAAFGGGALSLDARGQI